jgi:predicted acetyltransferase
MKLRPLSLADEAQAWQGHLELATESWEYLLGYAENLPWADYVEALHDESLGRNLKEGRVPATFLMAESEGILIGRASIRHELNDFLFNYGGHIGYGVRPKYRRQGFATEILRQSLTYLHGLGVSDVLLTCDEENVGSIRVIESQGGILENMMEFEGILKRRYWISRVLI